MMQYVCRGEECRAFRIAQFGFTTEDEFFSHWNTFHVAVMPQFICRHPSCGVIFAADLDALDRFLDHVTRRKREEAKTCVSLHGRHPLLPNPKAMELKPNPHYQPPNKHDEVPQRLSNVKAPPVYLLGQNPEDSALELRWAFRKLFGNKIK